MKPILFNTEMVRAILDGRKTVTRRPVKPLEKILKNPEFGYTAFTPKDHISVRGEWTDSDCEHRYGENFIKEPYLSGDILYVQEEWAKQQGVYWHKAGLVLDKEGREPHGTVAPEKWRPSIHMPREAARIFLRVEDVRVEKLQSILPEDGCLGPSNIQKEGVNKPCTLCIHPDFDCREHIKSWT